VWSAWDYHVHGSDHALARRDGRSWLTLRILLFVALVATLTPSVFTISRSGHFTTPVARYLSPFLLLLTLCAALFYSLRSHPGAHENPEITIASKRTAVGRAKQTIGGLSLTANWVTELECHSSASPRAYTLTPGRQA
jgi:hypothetical protein